MSVIWLFFHGCFLLFLDFCRLLGRGFKKLFASSRTEKPARHSEPDNGDELNELLTLEELLEDE